MWYGTPLNPDNDSDVEPIHYQTSVAHVKAYPLLEDVNQVTRSYSKILKEFYDNTIYSSTSNIGPVSLSINLCNDPFLLSHRWATQSMLSTLRNSTTMNMR
jgi:hypothetical protein